MTLKCPVANEDPIYGPEMKWWKLHENNLTIFKDPVFMHSPDKELHFFKNGTPKFYWLQVCDSGGKCQGGPDLEDYEVPDPQQFYLHNVTLEDSGLYW